MSKCSFLSLPAVTISALLLSQYVTADEPVVSLVNDTVLEDATSFYTDVADLATLNEEAALIANCGDTKEGCRSYGSCDCCCGPTWTFRAGAIVMDRQRPDTAVLVTDSFAPGGNVLLDAAQFDFDFELGYELAVIRHGVLGSCWDLEGRFFQIDGWKSTLGPTLSPGGAVIQFVNPLGNTGFPADSSATYTSDLINVEVNGRRQLTNRVQILAGFRYVELDERGITLMQDIGPGLNLATIRNGVVNKMYGFQLGADAVFPVRERLTVEAILKAGVYANDIENGTLITQSLFPGTFSSAAVGNNTAFLGELGFTAMYQVTSCLSVRATYQLMWMEGVALASDQIAVSDPLAGTATVDIGGSPFYHGAFLGLQLDL